MVKVHSGPCYRRDIVENAADAIHRIIVVPVGESFPLRRELVDRWSVRGRDEQGALRVHERTSGIGAV